MVSNAQVHQLTVSLSIFNLTLFYMTFATFDMYFIDWIKIIMIIIIIIKNQEHVH